MRKQFLISILLIALSGISCNAQTKEKPAPPLQRMVT